MKKHSYVFGALGVAGAVTLGAYLLLREPSEHDKKITPNYSTPASEDRPAIPAVTPAPLVLTENKLGREKVNDVAAGFPQREAPGFLEEVLLRPCFNEDYVNTFSRQLEELLTICPQWRKPEYVTSDTSLPGRRVSLTYEFRGMKIEEFQLLDHQNLDVEHGIVFTVYYLDGSEKNLRYTLPAHDKLKRLQSSHGFDNREFHTLINLSADESQVDERDTYAVQKNITHWKILEHQTYIQKIKSAKISKDQRDIPSMPKFSQLLKNQALPHNFAERVSKGLIDDVRSRIIMTFPDFVKSLDR